MGTPAGREPSRRTTRRNLIFGVVLVAAGLLGHVLAARAIAWNPMAYRHHVFGFFVILAVTGPIIALIGWRFWKDRRDLTVLIIGLVQAAFGLVVYLMRFHIA